MTNLFLTRKEFIEELGIDRKTFRKILSRNNIELPKGLIAPSKVEEIRIKLGLLRNPTDKKLTQQ